MEDFVTLELSKRLKEKGFPLVDYIPTIAQVMKWLREEKTIDIEIRPEIGRFGNKIYMPYVVIYKEYTWEESPDVIRLSIVRSTTHKSEEWETTLVRDFFDTWVEAAIKAIEYTLDNLI